MQFVHEVVIFCIILCRALCRIVSYHGVFRLDRFDMQVVLHTSGGAVLRGLLFPLHPASVPRLILAILLWCRRPRQQVASLLFGDVGLRAVHRLDVLPEGAGICVALRAARDLTDIGFLKKNTKIQGISKEMSNRLPDPRLIRVRNISNLIGVCPILVFGSV